MPSWVDEAVPADAPQAPQGQTAAPAPSWLAEAQPVAPAAPEAPQPGPHDLGVTEKLPAGPVTQPLEWARPPAPAPTADDLHASYEASRSMKPPAPTSSDPSVPDAALEFDPDLAGAQSRQRVFSTLPSHAPVVAQHLTDPSKMAKAKDDLEMLSDLEWTLTGGLVFGSGGPVHYQPPVWWEGLKVGVLKLRSDLEATRDQLGLDPSWTQALYPFSTTDWTERQRASRVDADLVAAAKELHAKSALGKIWVSTFQTTPLIAANVAASGVGGFGAMLAFNTSLMYGRNREALLQLEGPDQLHFETGHGEGAAPRGQKLSPETATWLAGGASLGEGFLYSIGVGGIGRGIAARSGARTAAADIFDRVMASNTLPRIAAKFIGRYGMHALEGAGTLAAATALEEASLEVGRMNVDPAHDFQLKSVWDRAADTFHQGLVDFALISAIAPARLVLHDLGVSRASAREASAMRDTAELLRNSPLAAKDPGEVEQVISKLVPGQTWLVDRGAWDRYWQSKNIDPEKKAAEIAGDEGRAYGGSAGGLISFPMDRYLARLGTTEHLLALAADGKATPEARTPREEAAYQASTARAVEESAKARGAAFEEDKRAVAQIIKDQALAAGVDREEAAANATLIAENAGAFSLRTGLPVKETVVLMGLSRYRILGPKGEAVAQATHEQLRQQLSPEARADLDAARSGDRRAQQRLEAAAYVDELTQVLNHRGFEDYRRSRTPGGWDVSIDVNDLKSQDVLGGHEVGDAMLKSVAEAMQAANESSGGKGRLFRRGGDEFHAGGFKSREEAQAFGEALAKATGGAKEIVPGFKPSVSMGIGPDVESSDRAAYTAKAKKTLEVGAYTKGQAFEKEKTGKGKSFIAFHDEAAPAPKNEVPVAKVAGKPVVLVTPGIRPERSAARVVTPQRPGAGEPVHYRVVEAEQLVPSHTPDSFTPNPAYPEGVQERDYRRQPEEQLKVQRGAQQLDPRFLLSDTPSALDGPPIVTAGEKALVLGGNGRSMMLLRGLKDEETARRYRAELAARAPGFGLDPAEIAKMKAPVLVRELDDVGADAPKKDLAGAVRRFNEGMTQALSPRVRAVAEAKTLSPATVKAIGELLAEGEGSLRDILRERPGAVLEILRRDGVITAQNQAEWMKGANLTDEGKERLEGMFVGRVVGTVDRMAMTPSALLAKVERIAPSLLRVDGVNPEMGETPTIQRAIDLVNEARSRHLELDQVVNQLGLFGGPRPDAAAIDVARLLEEAKPTDLQRRFQAWADRAAFDPRQVTLFGAPATKEEARSVLLGKESALAQAKKVEKADLVVQHNLTAENLLHADELGGLAVPSLAISKKGNALTGFGEITLLGESKLVDPATGTPVFDRDVWSPRWPETRWKMKEAAVRTFRDWFGPWAAKTGVYLGDAANELHEKGAEGTLERRDWRAALGLAYLAEKGRPVKDITEAVPAEKVDVAKQPAMRAFAKEHGVEHRFEENPEYHRALTEAYKAAVEQLAGSVKDEDIQGALRQQHLEVHPMFGKESWSAFDEETGLLDYNTARKTLEAIEAQGKRRPDKYAMEKAALKVVDSPKEKPAFEAWAKEKLAPMFGERGILKHRDTANGPSWYTKPYTLENVVREMTGGRIQQGDGGGGVLSGFGHLLAAAARKYQSLEAIKGDRERIRPLEETEELRSGLSDRVAELATELRKYHPRGEEMFGSFDAFLSSLSEAFKRGRSLEAELAKDAFDVKAMPADLKTQIRGLMQEVRDLPTGYFEAKPQRGVDLREFRAAVVPSDADPRAVEILKSHGLEVVPWKKKRTGTPEEVAAQEAARRKVIDQTAERFGLHFQGDPAGPRGLVRMRLDATGRPVDFPIRLLAGDASTLAHEGAHFISWAMHDVAMSPHGDAVRPDYEALVKWAGYDSPEQRLHENLERGDLEAREGALAPAEAARLKTLRAKEERIGHGFEQYLAEGKAPTAALARVYAWFRKAFSKVYQGLFGIQEQYRQHYGQDLQVTDEVRGIFDRWFAAETEVSRQGAEGRAARDEAMGELLRRLEPADRTALLRAQATREEEAERSVYTALLQADEAQNKDVRAEMRKQVEAELNAAPVWKLIDYLKREKAPEAGVVDVAMGNLDPALLDAHGKPWKLDRAELEDAFGEGIVRELPKGATAAKGGAPMDFLASQFGFASGEEMVTALRSAGDRDAAIEARTNERMREAFPTYADDPSAAVKAAVDAEHTPEAAEEALVGARILVRRVDPSLASRLKVMEDGKARKATVKKLIAEMKIADLSPQTFLSAERRWANEAVDLTGKALGKDTDRRREYAARAMDARDAQLLNAELWRQARDAQIEMGKGREFLREQTTDAGRRVLGKATTAHEVTKEEAAQTGRAEGSIAIEQPYLDRMDDLVSAIDWRKSGAASDRAERFQAWLETQPADAREDILSRVGPGLMKSLERPRHWKQLTVQEMRDLISAAEVIEAQAKLKSKLRFGKEVRDKEEAIAKFLAEVKDRFPGGAVSRIPRTEGLVRRIVQKVSDTKTKWTQRPEETYRQLGPVATKLGYEPMSEAEVRWRQAVREVSMPIMEEIEKLPSGERDFFRSKFTVVEERQGKRLEHRLDGEAALAIALNYLGNESNRYKTVAGEVTLMKRHFEKAPGMSEDTIKKIVGRLTRPQVEVIQRIWDRLSSKWPEMAELEARHTGLAPPKVEPKSFDLSFDKEGRQVPEGTPGAEKVHFGGGYYPMVYDFRFSTAGERMGERIEQGLGTMAFMGERAVTPQGHLQKRLETFARPIDMSLAALPRHVTETMKDLTMRDTLISVRDFLTDGRVRDAITEAMGSAAYNSLIDHWRRTANQAAVMRANWRLATKMRSMAAGGSIAWNVPVAAQHVMNLVPSFDKIPTAFMAPAIQRFAVEGYGIERDIFPLSSYMTQRIAEGTDRSIYKAVEELTGREGKLEKLGHRAGELGMFMIHGITRATADTAWLGAYEHATAPKAEGGLGLEAGKDGEAVKWADAEIRRTQTSYRELDRSLVEVHPITKHFTQFFGYMSSQLQMLLGTHADARLLLHQADQARERGELAEARDFQMQALKRVAKTYSLVIASGVMAEMLVGRAPPQPNKDTGEYDAATWAKWGVTTGLMFPLRTAPMARSFIDAKLGEQSRDVSFLPWTRIWDTAGNAIGAVHRAGTDEAKGDELWQAGEAALETFGWYYGLPVAQARRVGDYWLDLTPEGPVQSEESKAAGPGEAALGTVLGPRRPGKTNEALFGGAR